MIPIYADHALGYSFQLTLSCRAASANERLVLWATDQSEAPVWSQLGGWARSCLGGELLGQRRNKTDGLSQVQPIL